MNIQTIAVVCLVSLISAATASCCEGRSPTQDTTAESLFAGTWKFESLVLTSTDGERFYPYGETFYGMLMYDGKGYMSFLAMRPDRPEFESGDIYGGTDEEVRAAFENFDAYCGTYMVDVDKQTVTHHIEACRFPNWEGSRQIRHYEFSQNRLILSATLSAQGKEWQARAILVKRSRQSPNGDGA